MYKHKSLRIKDDYTNTPIPVQYTHINKEKTFLFKKTDAEPTCILTYILQQIFKMNRPNEIDLLSLHVTFNLVFKLRIN